MQSPDVNEQIVKQKEEKLADLLTSLDGVLVAFSGGVDSTYLLKKALDVLGTNRVLAVTAASETYPEREFREACRLALHLKARHRVINTSELSIENFAVNNRDRCYYCKKELFTTLQDLGDREGLAVVDGANLDDLQDHRPGFKAALELGIVSPLLEAGMTKEDIRLASRALGLPTWLKAPFACLASRFPYGQEITAENLRQVGRVEDLLFGLGFLQVRIRHHGPVARLEVLPEDRVKVLKMAEQIHAACRDAGFTYAALDLIGYRQGSMNEERLV